MSSSIAEEILGHNQYIAKVIPVRVQRDARDVSRSLPEDPFAAMYGVQGVIEPPYDPFTLSIMPEASSELGPAIEAMQVNIAKMGYRIITREGISTDENQLTEEVLFERAKVKNFFSNAVLEATETFTSTRAALRHDLESNGNGYIEVLRSLVTREPAGLKHLVAWTMRLTKEDNEFTECIVPRPVQNVDGSWKIAEFPYRKRFRRFVQIRDDQSNAVFFKEWGDPRPIDSETGLVISHEEVRSESFDVSRLATEVIHFKLYCSRSPYGLPRYIGNLFTVFGNRAAEVINYVTFRNNNVPAMMLLATNVQLTSGSIDRIKKFIEERVQGDNNYSTILIVEGEPISENMRDPGTMKLEIKELTASQHDDAMFTKYMERNDDKIRRAYRLAPIFMGRSEEYNRSTADASRKVTEEQVFRPERNSEDDVWNQTIVAGLGAAQVLFKSNTPDVTDNFELTQLLATAERSGGLSPHISRLIVEDVLGRELPPISSVIDKDVPFTMTMLREQLKAQTEVDGTQRTLDDEEVLRQLRYLKDSVVEFNVSEQVVRAIDYLIIAASSKLGV